MTTLKSSAQNDPPFDPSAAAELLLQRRKILVTAHVNPDGDALGSLCALARICLGLGKEVRLVCQSEVPDFLSWVELPCPLYSGYAELGGWIPDLAVFLDCGRPERAGTDGKELARGNVPPAWGRVDILNIDHHGDNPRFGLVNFVEEKAGATAELVGLLAERLGLALSGPLGENIYLGLSADSGNFSFSSATPNLFSMAARIVRNGLKVEEFIAKSENNWSPGRMRLWGELLLHLRLFAEGRVVSVLITNDMLARYHCKPGDLEGLVSFVRHLRSVDVSLLVRERGEGSKISLRSMGGARSVNVQRVAAHLGGGGHRSAAAAELPLPPAAAEKAVLEILLPAVEEFSAATLDEIGDSAL
ncbi:MAG: bifunctional oligoribonuclease/PAP phosphatase NrnA [Deltaproteobacteria bacterium]|jgi:phosphoesterase RecJ-like protein|nr:bifunctional oligoribonuclease/PAP phosphatase NrnA [Deltaproteobacteria bacterium]